MDREEDPWHISLLEASEDVEEKEFDIPLELGLEAFAEKIGIRPSEDEEGGDLEERPAPEVATASPP